IVALCELRLRAVSDADHIQRRDGHHVSLNGALIEPVLVQLLDCLFVWPPAVVHLPDKRGSRLLCLRNRCETNHGKQGCPEQGLTTGNCDLRVHAVLLSCSHRAATFVSQNEIAEQGLGPAPASPILKLRLSCEEIFASPAAAYREDREKPPEPRNGLHNRCLQNDPRGTAMDPRHRKRSEREG